MALDSESGRRSASPRGLDHEPLSLVSKARAEEAPYKKDKSYRRYAGNVERALLAFDNSTQEWADYISFLGRLLKVC